MRRPATTVGRKRMYPTGAKARVKAGSEDGRLGMTKVGKSPDVDVRGVEGVEEVEGTGKGRRGRKS